MTHPTSHVFSKAFRRHRKQSQARWGPCPIQRSRWWCQRRTSSSKSLPAVATNSIATRREFGAVVFDLDLVQTTHGPSSTATTAACLSRSVVSLATATATPCRTVKQTGRCFDGVDANCAKWAVRHMTTLGEQLTVCVPETGRRAAGASVRRGVFASNATTTAAGLKVRPPVFDWDHNHSLFNTKLYKTGCFVRVHRPPRSPPPPSRTVRCSERPNAHLHRNPDSDHLCEARASGTVS